MRYWLIILMLAIAAPFAPILRRAVTPAISLASHLITRNTSSAASQSLTTSKPLSKVNTMTEAIPQQNPLPVLSRAAPADPIKAQELPKLSTEDFRIYNRLAIMMDAYVSTLNSFKSTLTTDSTIIFAEHGTYCIKPPLVDRNRRACRYVASFTWDYNCASI